MTWAMVIWVVMDRKQLTLPLLINWQKKESGSPIFMFTRSVLQQELHRPYGVINEVAMTYGYDRLRFIKPVFINDTCKVRINLQTR